MDATHIHLVLTHFPIVGTIIGIGILAYGLYSNADSIKKTALVTFVIMAVLTFPVFLSGEEAEDSVEQIAGVSEYLIEDHEELAEKAIWLMGLLGAMSLVSLFSITKKLSSSKTILIVTMIVSLATASLFAVVGNLGGKIRHTEIQNNSENPQVEGDSNSKYDKDDDDDDDDDDD